jgi:hypothetical protein
MPTQNPIQASRTRALWVIAISLLVIAVCLVLIVIKLQGPKPVFSAPPQESEVMAAIPELENVPTPPKKTTNAGPRWTSPAIPQQPNPPIPAPAVSEPEAPPVQIPQELLPLIAVVNRTTHPGNTIVGRVTLRGTPPPERVMALNTQPSCPELQTNPPTTQDFIVGTNGELANVFVAITGQMNNHLRADSLTNHQLYLGDCKMTPLVSGILTSQALRFSNQSTDDHILKIVTTNRASSLNQPQITQVILYSGLTRGRPAFRRPEDFIAITCTQHPWEFAYVCAVENPFFAVSDTNGVFVIPNVPAGKYILKARHLKMSSANGLSREVIVKADQPAEVDFTFDITASQ